MLGSNIRETIISISSNVMGAGKTTFKNVFMRQADKYGLVVKGESFSSPVKRVVAAMLSEANGIDIDTIYEHMSDPKLKTRVAQPAGVFGGKTIRELLQLTGTEFGRELIDPNIWTGMMCNRILEHLKTHDVIIIDDTRFKNEHNTLKRFAKAKGLGFVDAYVYRPIETQHEHSSEGQMDFLAKSAKLKFYNTGTLGEYVDQCEFWAKRLALSLVKEDGIVMDRSLPTAKEKAELDYELMMMER